jgi:hypothetical protein
MLPDLLPGYQRAYPGAYAPPEYREKLNQRIERIRAQYGFSGPTQWRRALPNRPAGAARPQLALPLLPAP